MAGRSVRRTQEFNITRIDNAMRLRGLAPRGETNENDAIALLGRVGSLGDAGSPRCLSRRERSSSWLVTLEQVHAGGH
jgi:hypothetical protein